ncbi:hypothetical protein HK096_002025, partial [Nowakowskiella sp. JEL0078]
MSPGHSETGTILRSPHFPNLNAIDADKEEFFSPISVSKKFIYGWDIEPYASRPALEESSSCVEVCGPDSTLARCIKRKDKQRKIEAVFSGATSFLNRLGNGIKSVSEKVDVAIRAHIPIFKKNRKLSEELKYTEDDASVYVNRWRLSEPIRNLQTELRIPEQLPPARRRSFRNKQRPISLLDSVTEFIRTFSQDTPRIELPFATTDARKSIDSCSLEKGYPQDSSDALLQAPTD